MTVNRRNFLIFLGASAGTVALQPVLKGGQSSVALPFQSESALAQGLPTGLKFQPIKGSMPLMTDVLAPDKQLTDYSQFVVQDNIVLPEGYTYDVLVSWGDRVGQGDR
ncbi:MAG: phosphatase, partial [Leptolyngbyaceae cyanobacterium CSU_1_4]|nr:phosphatase [Leptolyngbyaceae cyanobacterium CSU_1_4]